MYYYNSLCSAVIIMIRIYFISVFTMVFDHVIDMLSTEHVVCSEYLEAMASQLK